MQMTYGEHLFDGYVLRILESREDEVYIYK